MTPAKFRVQGVVALLALAAGCGSPSAARGVDAEPLADDTDEPDAAALQPPSAEPPPAGDAPRMIDKLPDAAVDSSSPAPRPLVDAPAASDGPAMAADRPADASLPPDAAVLAPPCAGQGHPFCSDFENGVFDEKWKGGSSEKVEPGRVAHGKYAVHVTNLAPRTTQFFTSTALGAFKHQFWGRLYFYLTAGAPAAYGALVLFDGPQGAYDISYGGNKWAAGWYGIGETFMHSGVKVPADRWVCLEFYIDGSTPAPPRVWQDGVEVQWLGKLGDQPGFKPVNDFAHFYLGLNAKQGTSLTEYTTAKPPAATDIWFDDIALDHQRIGCIK